MRVQCKTFLTSLKNSNQWINILVIIANPLENFVRQKASLQDKFTDDYFFFTIDMQ